VTDESTDAILLDLVHDRALSAFVELAAACRADTDQTATYRLADRFVRA